VAAPAGQTGSSVATFATSVGRDVSPPVGAGATVSQISPNTRWVLSGPFARIHYRDELLDDLEYAVKPHTTPTVLALFGFKNLKERLETMLEPDGNLLLGQIATRLADAAGTQAVLYEPRRGDFCALFSGDLERTKPLLEQAVANIDAETEALGITTVLGVVELPGEADTPALALDLADTRRRQIGGELRPNRRQTVYTRVSSTLGRSHELSETA